MICVTKTEILCFGKDRDNLDIKITKETSMKVIDLTLEELNNFIDTVIDGDEIFELDDGSAYRLSPFIKKNLKDWIDEENRDDYLSKKDVESLKKVADILEKYFDKGWEYIEY